MVRYLAVLNQMMRCSGIKDNEERMKVPSGVFREKIKCEE